MGKANITEIRVPVRELVEFACRSGDLMAAVPAGPTAQEGIRAHQKIQKQRPAGSEAEYKLKVELEHNQYTFALSGRVDILHPQTDLHRPPQLDEIKTTYCSPDKLASSQKELHWAQLKIYGFCYCLEQEQAGVAQEQLALQMLWYNLKEKKLYPQLREFSRDDLEIFTRSALTLYAEWYRQLQRQRQALQGSAKALDFPFPEYRAGQRKMAVSVYRSLRERQSLMVEAPTGIGKTVSSLYPAIKGIGEDLVDSLVYLTAKNSGRQVVREAVLRMREQGLSLSLLIIQARDKTCACRTGLCSLDEEGVCPRTRGFYDRLPAARQVLLEQEVMTPDAVAQVADEHRICPFELSLQMLPWANLVVCDFNYVFDPLVSLSHFQQREQRTALLIDEAHNLGDRSREMYSVCLRRSESRRAAKCCQPLHPVLHRGIQSLVRALDRWVRNCDDDLVVKTVTNLELRPQTVTRAVTKLIEILSSLSEEGKSYPDEIGEWIKNLYRYVRIEQLLGENHRSLTRIIRVRSGQHHGKETRQWQEQELKLLCLNASEYLKQRYDDFQAVIFFSATLCPAHYFYRQLGLEQQVPYLALPSPFASQQLGAFLCPYVDTRYQQRQRAIEPIVDIIARVYQGRPGNYLVFFPSYQFMHQVAEHFLHCYPNISLVQQVSGSSDEERAIFLENFSRGQRSLGFAIMGGIFGEGVDYVGDQLVGAIVIGVGLPQISEEQELIRNACEEQGDNGFDFAYRYPGMTRVLQTAGRVIRSETDHGVLVLVDNRFTETFYKGLYPDYWQLKGCFSGEVLSEALSSFWHS